jgi:putative two-component system response regulator
MLDHQVLVVDDDVRVAEFFQVGLTRYGYDVETAHNTASAQECLRTSPFSFVLCDEEMPGGSGMDLLRYTSRVYPHLPFMMVTGRGEVDLARESIACGALDFVTKPVRIEELVRRIEQGQVRVERDRGRIAAVSEEVLGGAIQALVAAIDAKDPSTASHSERVSEIALRIGHELGLEGDMRLLLKYSGLLHDVGKIAIPEHVLTKPGKLDEEEWKLIRQHPVRSAEILRRAPALAEVATVVRHHHERMDGRGYPDRLAGHAIPFLSRLLTIADVYEALTSHRSYRPALSDGEARAIIHAGRETQFDGYLEHVFQGIKHLP